MENKDILDELHPVRERPAGFLIRVVASFIDNLVFVPLIALGFYALISAKSVFLCFLISLPGLFYKPLMEAFYGATLGKMAVGIRVVDDGGSNLSIAGAYLRFSPFLARSIFDSLSMFWLFSVPEFKSASGFMEVAQVMQQSPSRFSVPGTLLGWFILIDCVTAAFTARKRAIHDMMAQSYCVYSCRKTIPNQSTKDTKPTQKQLRALKRRKKGK